MKFLQQSLFHFQEKAGSIKPSDTVDGIRHGLLRSFEKIKGIKVVESMKTLGRNSNYFLTNIKSLGASEAMDDYEKRKLGIFNQLNFFQLATGITIPVAGLFGDAKLPAMAWFIASLPALISILVLVLNYLRKYQAAIICYFILYPVFTSIVYMNSINLGVELFFILYGILSVFFLQDIGYMLFSISLSMISYFMLAVVLKNYQYQLEAVNMGYYLFNQALAIIFIFYGLFLIKKENAGYQLKILNKNHALNKKNLQIEQQKKEIAEKAELLKDKTTELTELNTLKNKLFSVIAHDLKAPMYALRNLFRNIQLHDLPAEEIKTIVPDVVNDLNFTVGLMENLLQWAKSQMQSDVVRPIEFDITQAIDETIQLLRLQAETKQICIEHKRTAPVYVSADRDMINLVLRNLLSNAIKFTPAGGRISAGANEVSSFVEVFVQDNGTGISKEALQKINKNDYYTTRGTASESGTGLGLMLCKEFLARNGGQMHIESEPGNGSLFSFTLPQPD